MTAENINLVLTNANCCISAYAVKVSKLLSTNSLCAESEVLKLKMMNDYYKAASCYDTTPIVTISNDVIPEIISLESIDTSSLYLDNISNIADTYNLLIKDVINITVLIPGDGVTKIGDLIVAELIAQGLYINHSVTFVGDRTGTTCTYTFDLTCTVYELSISVPGPFEEIIGTELQVGFCGTEVITYPENCLTSEELDIVINKLMLACEICPCQLT
jgi:hypothetical protein